MTQDQDAEDRGVLLAEATVEQIIAEVRRRGRLDLAAQWEAWLDQRS